MYSVRIYKKIIQQLFPSEPSGQTITIRKAFKAINIQVHNILSEGPANKTCLKLRAIHKILPSRILRRCFRVSRITRNTEELGENKID